MNRPNHLQSPLQEVDTEKNISKTTKNENGTDGLHLPLVGKKSLPYRAPVGPSSSRRIKLYTLTALLIQNSSLVLMIRCSRMRAKQAMEAGDVPYVVSTSVVMAEACKFLLNLFLERVMNQQQTTPTTVISDLATLDTVRLAIPSLLYVLQNNLLFVALGNLPVPVYQVTNQGKLLATAICSRLLLRRKFTYWQYGSLLVLATGVAITQLSAITTNEHQATKEGTSSHQQSRQLIGLLAMFVSAFTSGFAGVYFEKVVKEKASTKAAARSVYFRNMQLSLWGMLLGLLAMITKGDLDIVRTHGFFAGYDGLLWGVVANQAIGGLLVGLVMKHADTILKVFATSGAIVVATAISVAAFGDQVDTTFLLGMTLVIVAVALYNRPAVVPKTRAVSLISSVRFKTWRIIGLAIIALWCSTTFLMLRKNHAVAPIPDGMTESKRGTARARIDTSRRRESNVTQIPDGMTESKRGTARARINTSRRRESNVTPRTKKCAVSRADLMFEPTKDDIKGWMKQQPLDGPVLIEDRHDQYSLTKGTTHRLERLARGEYELHNNTERRATLEDILEHVDLELNRLNVSYVLWSGTLLGAYRHHDFIPWDDDVDIAISKEGTDMLRHTMIERAKALATMKEKTPSTRFQWVIRAKKDSDIICAKVVDLHNGYYVDIFSLDSHGPSSDLVGWYWSPPKCFPREAMFPTQPCTFGKHICQCPNDPKKILTINYPSGLGVPRNKLKAFSGPVFEGIKG